MMLKFLAWSVLSTINTFVDKVFESTLVGCSESFFFLKKVFPQARI